MSLVFSQSRLLLLLLVAWNVTKALKELRKLYDTIHLITNHAEAIRLFNL